MPTLMKDVRRDFACPLLASREARALLIVLLVVTSSGCSSLGFLPGVGGGSKSTHVDQLSPQEAVDEVSATRAKMTLAPKEPYWPFHLGELYVAADSTALAVRSLQQSLALDASYAPAASLLSKIYYDAAMHAEGIDLLEGFLSHNPTAPDALRAALALHYEAIGEIEKANAALAGCANNARDAQNARVMVALRGTDAQAALANAKRALDADDKSAANHNNYGIALLYAGRPLEAREAFRAALDLNKKLPGALYNMAIVETFYFFDDAAGREWFSRYKQFASEDPDNLTARFQADVSRTGSR